MADFNQTAAQEMRSFAHQAVTEGVDLRYLERMRQQLYAAADALEAAEKERDEALMRLKREQAASDAESEALTIRMQQAEKERDEARADTQKVWDTLEREVKAREAAEKERDEAVSLAQQIRNRAERAEARLAESQEALERVIRRCTWPPGDNTFDYAQACIAVVSIARAALTTHPADE